MAADNKKLYYDNRNILERFKGPYKNDIHIKIMVISNIDDIQFDINSAFISPHSNISYNNIGEVYKMKEIFFPRYI